MLMTFSNSHITVLEFSSRERKNSARCHFNGSLWWKTWWCGVIQELARLSSRVSLESVTTFSASWTGGAFTVALRSNGKLVHMLPELVSFQTFGWPRTSSMGATWCCYMATIVFHCIGIGWKHYTLWHLRMVMWKCHQSLHQQPDKTANLFSETQILQYFISFKNPYRPKYFLEIVSSTFKQEKCFWHSHVFWGVFLCLNWSKAAKTLCDKRRVVLTFCASSKKS